ncbi:hypothetical protein GS682_29605 [Nostoc sp. B(2019)]|nr:hypothetical protein [Nostoc sp. B(2019)]
MERSKHPTVIAFVFGASNRTQHKCTSTAGWVRGVREATSFLEEKAIKRAITLIYRIHYISSKKKYSYKYLRTQKRKCPKLATISKALAQRSLIPKHCAVDKHILQLYY